jgi:hypothetical protein
MLGQAVAVPVPEQSVLAMAVNLLQGDPFAERGMRKALAHATASPYRSALANAHLEPSAKVKPLRKGTWTAVPPPANPPHAQGVRDHGPRTVPTGVPAQGVLRQVASGAKRRTAERTPRLPWTD